MVMIWGYRNYLVGGAGLNDSRVERLGVGIVRRTKLLVGAEVASQEEISKGEGEEKLQGSRGAEEQGRDFLFTPLLKIGGRLTLEEPAGE